MKHGAIFYRLKSISVYVSKVKSKSIFVSPFSQGFPARQDRLLENPLSFV
jgi:hypothetical protein